MVTASGITLENVDITEDDQMQLSWAWPTKELVHPKLRGKLHHTIGIIDFVSFTQHGKNRKGQTQDSSWEIIQVCLYHSKFAKVLFEYHSIITHTEASCFF